MQTSHKTVGNYTRRIFIVCMLLVSVINYCTQMRSDQCFAAMYYDFGYSHWFDFFEPLINTQYLGNAYSGTMYPPLALLFFRILQPFIPIRFPMYDHIMGRHNPVMVQIFVIFLILTTVIYTWILSENVRGNKRSRFLFAICSVLIYPYLFAVERGNIIIVSVIFSMLFAFYKDSDNKVLREFSLVALALSAALKLYPAFFGLVLLAEKRYSDALRCIIYGLLLFFLPFALLGSLSQIPQMVEHLFTFISFSSVNTPFIYCPSLDAPILAVCSYLLKFYGIMINYPLWLRDLLTYLPTVLAGVALFTLRDNWKRWYALMLPLCSLPGVTRTYTLLFLIIPLVLYNNQERLRKRDYLYLLPTCMAFLPITFSDSFSVLHTNAYRLSEYNTWFEFAKQPFMDSLSDFSLCVLFSCLVTVVLFIIILIDCIITLRERKAPVAVN